MTDVWLNEATRCPSEHYDLREPEQAEISLLVIHNISLPPAEKEEDFANNNVEDFFTGKLDWNAHPYFKTIEGVRVSAHLYIKRDGQLIQFVPLNKRAWHAGVSEFDGRTKCNDFSIGIEMQGTDNMPFTDLQYQTLIKATNQIQALYPEVTKHRIVGHSDIAPGRKTDPGPCFDWNRVNSEL